MNPLSGVFHYSIAWLSLIEELVRESLYHTMEVMGKGYANHMFTHSFIYSSIHLSIQEVLLRIYYLPGIVVSAGVGLVNKTPTCGLLLVWYRRQPLHN